MDAVSFRSPFIHHQLCNSALYLHPRTSTPIPEEERKKQNVLFSPLPLLLLPLSSTATTTLPTTTLPCSSSTTTTANRRLNPAPTPSRLRPFRGCRIRHDLVLPARRRRRLVGDGHACHAPPQRPQHLHQARHLGRLGRLVLERDAARRVVGLQDQVAARGSRLSFLCWFLCWFLLLCCGGGILAVGFGGLRGAAGRFEVVAGCDSRLGLRC